MPVLVSVLRYFKVALAALMGTHVVPFFGEGERGDAVHYFAHISSDRHCWAGTTVTVKCSIRVSSELVSVVLLQFFLLQ